MKSPEEYRSTHLVPVSEADYDNVGYVVIEVLPFLKGRPWDEVALAFVTTLHPASIRVTEGTIKLDARVDRVTVYVDKENVIQGIEQECLVWLPESVEDGDALEKRVGFKCRLPL
jgi:hypothetical protein